MIRHLRNPKCGYEDAVDTLAANSCGYLSVEKMLGSKLAIIGTIANKKKAGKKHKPSGSTHLTESERTRCSTSFAACERVNISSNSSAAEIGAPVISDREMAFIAGASSGYFSAVYDSEGTRPTPRLHRPIALTISLCNGSVAVSKTSCKASNFVSPAFVPSRKISMNWQTSSCDRSVRDLLSKFCKTGSPNCRQQNIKDEIRTPNKLGQRNMAGRLSTALRNLDGAKIFNEHLL